MNKPEILATYNVGRRKTKQKHNICCTPLCANKHK